ncbi:methyl-accepting chemotaxis protein [Leptospira ilyithenensis]|uniref:Chemotaxis protein n=1 Tax=Leptospira ilyithenensis TaxID=2484901 RepID=A0A4V3JWR1_9LEPT|nr:methyl-accepting chemotaxis protein [Leptospira ilyithenensis]TGN07948.1 chemotaxis protein [Leptospira ilyithenensis]
MAGELVDFRDSGAQIANRIRIGFTLMMFAVGIFAMATTQVTAISIFNAFLEIIILSYAFWQISLLSKGKSIAKLARYFLFSDMVIYSVLFLSYTYTGANAQAKLVMVNMPFFIMILFFILFYSGFLLSYKLTLISGYAAMLALIINDLIVVLAGVPYSFNPTEPDQISLFLEIIKFSFFITGVYIIASVVKFMVKTTDQAAFSSEESEKKSNQALSTKNRIKEEADSLNGNVSKMQNSMDSLNTEIQTQVSSVEEISASMEELAASMDNASHFVRVQFKKIEELNQESNTLNQILKEVRSATDSLGETTLESQKYGKEVSSAMDSLNENFHEVEGSFQKVEDVNQIMREIADRTNLLALNASIEAARAGDQGRGFAVVAQEVAKLADSASENASLISKIISQAAKQIQNGNKAALDTKMRVGTQEKGFFTLVTHLDQLKDRVGKQGVIHDSFLNSFQELYSISEQLETITSEQKSGTSEISRALQTIEQSSSMIADSSSNFRENLEELAVQSDRLVRED